MGVDVRELLEAAVSGINGQTRPGQVEMAEAVNTSMHDGSHLLVQAGTGTGKSLGYLVPALLHAIEDRRVVVSTATLALQSQLVDRDVPALLDATEKLLPAQTVVRDPEGPQQLRLPAPDPRGRAGRRRHAHRRPAARPDRPAGARAARLGRAAAARRRGRRPRPRALASVPGLAAGRHRRPRVPRRAEVPVRRGVLRREGQGAGPQGRHRHHEPRAALDRRLREPHGPARARRRHRRRGARAAGPGHRRRG